MCNTQKLKDVNVHDGAKGHIGRILRNCLKVGDVADMQSKCIHDSGFQSSETDVMTLLDYQHSHVLLTAISNKRRARGFSQLPALHLVGRPSVTSPYFPCS